MEPAAIPESFPEPGDRRGDPEPLPPLPAPEIVELDGVPVATWHLGPDDGALDVVLCHGTPWSARTWSAVARSLARRHRVHLWDMPGYGLSGRGADVPLGLAAQAERLAALLERWGLEAPHLIAHDIGGAVALRAHLLHRRDLASLALLDVVTLDPWGSPFFRLVAEHDEVFAAIPAELHAAMVRAYIRGALVRPVPEHALDLLVEPWTGAAGRETFGRQIAALDPADTRPLHELLGRVRCPSLVLWGDQDPWIDPDQAGRLVAALPDAQGPIPIEGAGHLVAVEAPEEVAAALDRWLDGPPDRGGVPGKRPRAGGVDRPEVPRDRRPRPARRPGPSGQV